MTAEARFDALARAHGPRILGYLARRVDPPADAADLLSETLLVAWRRLDDVPEAPEEAIAWLFGVARRVLANQRRGNRRRSALVDELREHVSGAVRAPDAAAALDIRAALRRLPAGDRELLTLTAWDGLTAAQAAAVVGIEPAAARKRLQRARERLRELLGEPLSPPAARSAPARAR